MTVQGPVWGWFKGLFGSRLRGHVGMFCGLFCGRIICHIWP